MYDTINNSFSTQILGGLRENAYLCNVNINLKPIWLMWIPCMCCGKEFDQSWSWWICDTCGYRVCPSCMNSFKCPKCSFGHFQRKSL